MVEAPLTRDVRLRVLDLHRSYDRPVLSGVSFGVGHGETIAIIGRSGTGKSTLLRCLSVNETPDSGDAFLDSQQYLRRGISLFQEWEIRRQIMLVYQDYALFPNMTAHANITLGLRRSLRLPSPDAASLARDIAAQLRIEDCLAKYPSELSGGQAQRLALARALVLRPKVLLLDEITAALDPETTRDVVSAIRSIRLLPDCGDLSIVLVTHLLAFATGFADRILFLHNGVVHEEGPATSFVREAQKPETRAFLAAALSPI